MLPDAAHLLAMLIAARDVQEVAEGMTREELETSKRDQMALAKAVELVGEAARRVSAETKHAHSHIPWRKIVGMRHRLVHDYQSLDLDVLWLVVQNEIPDLIAALERIVPPEEEV